MTPAETIRALLDLAARDIELDPRAPDRAAARAAWSTRTAQAWYEAHKRMDAAWDRIFADLPDDLTDEQLEELHLQPPPEAAEVERLHQQMRAAIDRDHWPRHLHWHAL